ncbi:hypothetical protein [Oceanisphaera sp. IT1-181]|uniref:hypothetical protein n=1 Tax=Oceanisphaera sp. IT1-181 TaxID=3081199 RepID=UPI0029CA7337|nr:hypothetical protein [Oceanisphaera sp. IT1-181]
MMRLRLGVMLVGATLTLGVSSVSFAQKAIPDDIQETLVDANKGSAVDQYNLGAFYVEGSV